MDEKIQYTDQQFISFFKLSIDVKKESDRQIHKWGIQTHSLFEWITYTLEELGETSKAISEFEYRNGNLQSIYDEAIQTATLSLKIAEMVLHKME